MTHIRISMLQCASTYFIHCGAQANFKIPQRNMWKVYVIKSQEGLIHTGITYNLERRLIEHNSGASRWTKRGSHWSIVYSEGCFSIKDARKREKYFKNNAGKEWLIRKHLL